MNLRWEKRIDHSFCIEISDSGSAHMPITLRIPVATHGVPLQFLIDAWCQDPSHAIGLAAPSDLLLLHIERYYAVDSSVVLQQDCMVTLDGPVMMPVLLSDGMEVHYTPYSVVAVTHHLGQDQAGHTRASLVMQTEDLMLKSAYTDDNQGAELADFPGRSTTSVLMWLCRTDALRLPKVEDLSFSTTLDQRLLAVLNGTDLRQAHMDM